MNRDELVRSLVLAEISDDYEEPTHVHGNVVRRAGACGVRIDYSEVERILQDLVQLGLAKAYVLSTTGPASEVPAPIPSGRVADLYYWATSAGLDALASSRPSWPVDEDRD